MLPRLSARLAWPLAAIAVLTAGGCRKAAEPAASAAPEVGYVVIRAQDVPLEFVRAGRTTAYETSDVRPQVSGVLLARRFEEGAQVQQGQTLYQIDPSLFQAAVAQAAANLAAAQATYADAEIRAERFKPLADIEAVSKQDYADALAAARTAAAQIAQAQAALQTAQINLRFTRVEAPITGRIGRSLVTTGALVTDAQATVLSTIERLDPIFVDIPQSSADMVALQQSLSGGGVAPASADVSLTLENGTPYPYTGRLQFSEAVVDPNTGSVTLRARFPNPDGLLLPGMFVRARLAQAVARNAVLAPQQAVSRDPRGAATVMVVGPGNRALLRSVQADRTIGEQWLVTRGLAPGDRVITEGLDRIQPNDAIRPKPATAVRPASTAQAPPRAAP